MSNKAEFGNRIEPLDEKTREKIMATIKMHCGLYSNPFNEWVQINGCSSEDVEELAEIMTYEERLRAFPSTSALAEFIITNSDPDRVAKFNELVNLYNTDLPRIKKERDYKKARELAQEAFKLIKTKPE